MVARCARYGVAAGAVVLAVAGRAAFTPLWGPTFLPFVFFYPAIVFAAWYGRFGPALLSIVLSALAADWFFMEHGTAWRSAIPVRWWLW